MDMKRSAKGSTLQPCKLTDEQLLAIGRLVRACAELEDLVDLYLCELAELGVGQSLILLGRMSVSSKIRLAETFAVSKGDDYIEKHRECFDNEYYRAVMKCRNTVAHGLMLGRTEDNEIAFQVQESVGLEGTKVTVAVNAYVDEAFAIMATMVEDIVPQIETRLELTALRQKRREQALSPHPKAPTSEKRKAKRERQPPPSAA